MRESSYNCTQVKALKNSEQDGTSLSDILDLALLWLHLLINQLYLLLTFTEGFWGFGVLGFWGFGDQRKRF